MGSSAGFIDKFGFKSQTSRREREANKRMGDRLLLGEVPVCRRWYMIIFLQARNHKKPSVVFGGDCQKRFHNHMFFLNIWVFVSQFFGLFQSSSAIQGKKRQVEKSFASQSWNTLGGNSVVPKKWSEVTSELFFNSAHKTWPWNGMFTLWQTTTWRCIPY